MNSSMIIWTHPPQNQGLFSYLAFIHFISICSDVSTQDHWLITWSEAPKILACRQDQNLVSLKFEPNLFQNKSLKICLLPAPPAKTRSIAGCSSVVKPSTKTMTVFSGTVVLLFSKLERSSFILEPCFGIDWKHCVMETLTFKGKQWNHKSHRSFQFNSRFIKVRWKQLQEQQISNSLWKQVISRERDDVRRFKTDQSLDSKALQRYVRVSLPYTSCLDILETLKGNSDLKWKNN